MILRSSIVTPNTADVVTLEEFKIHLRWDATNTTEDGLMDLHLQAATKQVEAFTRRVLRSSAWQTLMESFPSTLKFDVAPVDPDSIVVKYFNTDNVEETLPDTEYHVHDNGEDDYIEIDFYGTMPKLYDRYNPVKIEYTAGHTIVPRGIKVAIMELAANYFENREGKSDDQTNMATLRTLYPYKII